MNKKEFHLSKNDVLFGTTKFEHSRPENSLDRKTSGKYVTSQQRPTYEIGNELHDRPSK